MQPIIVKKIKKSAAGHHGGAWKVAYADFVTAMMAFFLLMWLLNATTEEQRAGIADYFDPKIPISQNSAGGMNMFNGDSVFAQEKLARNALGGAGKKAAAGRDSNERHEVADSDTDVWSKGSKKQELLGSKRSYAQKFEKGLQKFTAINKDADMTADEIQEKIEKTLDSIADGQGLKKYLNFKMTDEGLRIDITDGENTPMFASASQEPTLRMRKILSVVGSVLSQLVNDIAVTGHTDSVPLIGKRNYSNWELSSDRANAARRTIVDAGIEIQRIKRVEGRADIEPFIKDDPKSPQNRRIGIVLLRDTSKEAIRKKLLEEAKQKALEEKRAYEEKLERDERPSQKIIDQAIGAQKESDGKVSVVPDPLEFR